ncbi:hypothetical protein RCOM_1589490 [Ricinus communis]|uniref:Serine-threonine protein kinase, plant-type n=1 Tax=Ricinus communis TaxID=3988 RepID=B9R779_RICCO|nr:hypothetical protein RCOM_1589490 [Ricinus communis]
MSGTSTTSAYSLSLAYGLGHHFTLLHAVSCHAELTLTLRPHKSKPQSVTLDFSELDLINNKFMAGFPANILTAKKLTVVDIRFNNYLGDIPAQAFNIDTDVLFINNNQFNQTIPANFGNTPALYITVANNNFT